MNTFPETASARVNFGSNYVPTLHDITRRILAGIKIYKGREFQHRLLDITGNQSGYLVARSLTLWVNSSKTFFFSLFPFSSILVSHLPVSPRQALFLLENISIANGDVLQGAGYPSTVAQSIDLFTAYMKEVLVQLKSMTFEWRILLDAVVKVISCSQFAG